MLKYLVQFERLKKGALFSKSGYRWLKRSTRTAEIVRPGEYIGTWFYFANRDTVEITDLGVLKDDN